ncbi:hypothetical protein NC651_012143 [Populus alba x Populus x berolinensis]|nr:hypothetical protein NC651_012143 [Populus alba x Populus x berolinensis]
MGPLCTVGPHIVKNRIKACNPNILSNSRPDPSAGSQAGDSSTSTQPQHITVQSDYKIIPPFKAKS